MSCLRRTEKNTYKYIIVFFACQSRSRRAFLSSRPLDLAEKDRIMDSVTAYNKRTAIHSFSGSVPMLYFQSDYLEGCDPAILKVMTESNLDQTPGYGQDVWCDLARRRIREAVGLPDADVHFLVGGTQTNSTVIRGLLRNYEGVISAETGHVCGHEGGAIEATGHKVLTIPMKDGKISAEGIEACWRAYADDESRDHLVRPGMVYLSHPTELGTLYKKSELESIYAVCQRLHLPLFIDGARLGYGLASPASDLTLSEIARLCDVFYIGGTKVGALMGEAVVVPNPALLPHFFTTMKQSGAVLAKGRLLGIQFATLFEHQRYLKIAGHAIDMARKLTAAFREKGYRFYLETESNQIFIIMKNADVQRLEPYVMFTHWGPLNEEEQIVRFVTSWATREENVEQLIKLL